MSEYRLRIDTSADRVLEFLSRLAEDDDFRDQLAQEPKKVLFEYGVEASDELIPAEVELPAKETVQLLLSGNLQEAGMPVAGPGAFFPVFAAFYAFPFLTGPTSSS